MGDKGGDGLRAAAVPWDEAREVLALVLLASAVLYLAAPMIRHAVVGDSYTRWNDLYGALINVDALTGVLLLGAAVTVCTTPAADVVPRLRRIVQAVAAVIAVLAVVTIVNVLTVPTLGESALLRLSIIAWGGGPAVVLSVTSWWMARRVMLLG